MAILTHTVPSCNSCGLDMLLHGLTWKCYACLTFQAQHCPRTIFDSTAEFGYAYKYNGKYDAIGQDDFAHLITEANKIIPQGYYFEIRGKIPANYGREKSLAWYYHPNFMLPTTIKHAGRCDPPLTDTNAGCYILGGFITGQLECGAGIVIGEVESNCVACGGSWYDHIGFRAHLEGEARLRTSCRIAYCRCPGYVPIEAGEIAPNHHREVT